MMEKGKKGGKRNNSNSELQGGDCYVLVFILSLYFILYRNTIYICLSQYVRG